MRPRIDLLLAAAVAMASLTHQARAVDASDTQSGANGDVISGKWVNPQSPGSHVRIFQNGNEFSAAGGAEVDTGPYNIRGCHTTRRPPVVSMAILWR
jgi:hypothetical protein